MADKDRLGSDSHQLELDTQVLELDGVTIDTLRNMSVGTPTREGELAVEYGSQAGDWQGLSAYINGSEMPIVGGRANVDGISGEISLAGYQYGSAISDSEVLDDWADGQLTSGRDGFDTTPYQFGTEDRSKFNPAGTRPTWTIDSGSPSVGGNTLSYGDSDMLNTSEAADPTTFDDGLAWEIRVGSGATANGPVARFWSEDRDNEWHLFLDIRSGEGARLDKVEGGTTTNGVIQSSELPDGCTVRIEHDGVDGWELFVDGVSDGTATDSFAPAANEMILSYSSSGSADLNSLSVYPRTP